MNRNILSVVVSASVVFSAGTAAAAENLNNSIKPVILENSDVQIDMNNPETQFFNPAIERFNIAENVEAIIEISVQETQNTQQTEQIYEENQKAEETQTVSYSDSDLYWLSRIIEAEASGESTTGKIAVGNCVLNRVKSGEFPNTIYDVIFDRQYGVQYQPTANGAIYNTPSAESVQAAKDALNGTSVVGDAMYFCSTKVAPTSWASKNRAYLTTIGNHVFYL